MTSHPDVAPDFALTDAEQSTVTLRDKLAEVLFEQTGVQIWPTDTDGHGQQLGFLMTSSANTLADAVLAWARELSVSQQAELIGGAVELMYSWREKEPTSRVITPWRKGQP